MSISKNFRRVRELNIETLLDFVMTDFEVAITNATKEIVGGDKVKCCFFLFFAKHFSAHPDRRFAN